MRVLLFVLCACAGTEPAPPPADAPASTGPTVDGGAADAPAKAASHGKLPADAAAFCDGLFPDGPAAAGIAMGGNAVGKHEIWVPKFKTMRTPFDHDAEAFLKCTWGPSGMGIPKLQIQAECGDFTFDAPFCAKQVEGSRAAVALLSGASKDKSHPMSFKGAHLYDEPLDGAVCHTMGEGLRSNHVFLANGCYFDVFPVALPDEGRREALYGVAAKLAASIGAL